MAANSKTIIAQDAISPKVFWPLLLSVVLTFGSVALAAVTPEMLEGAGAFAVPLALGLQGIAVTVAGYLKSDKFMNIGKEAAAAILPDEPVTSSTTPDISTADIPVTEDDTTADELQSEISGLGYPDGTGSHRA